MDDHEFAAALVWQLPLAFRGMASVITPERGTMYLGMCCLRQQARSTSPIPTAAAEIKRTAIEHVDHPGLAVFDDHAQRSRAPDPPGVSLSRPRRPSVLPAGSVGALRLMVSRDANSGGAGAGAICVDYLLPRVYIFFPISAPNKL